MASVTLLWPKHGGAGRGKQRGKGWFEAGSREVCTRKAEGNSAVSCCPARSQHCCVCVQEGENTGLVCCLLRLCSWSLAGIQWTQTGASHKWPHGIRSKVPLTPCPISEHSLKPMPRAEHKHKASSGTAPGHFSHFQ